MFSNFAKKLKQVACSLPTSVKGNKSQRGFKKNIYSAINTAEEKGEHFPEEKMIHYSWHSGWLSSALQLNYGLIIQHATHKNLLYWNKISPKKVAFKLAIKRCPQKLTLFQKHHA